jgi:hypothetical protein
LNGWMDKWMDGRMDGWIDDDERVSTNKVLFVS